MFVFVGMRSKCITTLTHTPLTGLMLLNHNILLTLFPEISHDLHCTLMYIVHLRTCDPPCSVSMYLGIGNLVCKISWASSTGACNSCLKFSYSGMSWYLSARHCAMVCNSKYTNAINKYKQAPTIQNKIKVNKLTDTFQSYLKLNNVK